MRSLRFGFLLLLFFIPAFIIFASGLPDDTSWQASWITSQRSQSESNSWICFRKEVRIKTVPASAMARIAVDSKYWLWINGKMVVFEGGLKRGPDPNDTYYDEVDIAPFLQKGNNTLAILLWYFGKDGFSHKSSGKAGLIFQCITPEVQIISDKSWQATMHPAYEHTQGIEPNFRLSESNVRFDARRDIGNWQNPDYDTRSHRFESAVELGIPPVSPWNKLVKRSIPQWKNFGLQHYVNVKTIESPELDTIICDLPYNAQITPYLKLESSGEGKTIQIFSDDYYGGGDPNVRAEYVTHDGTQEYESFGWFNGQKVIYVIPKGIKIIEVKYRETGYDTELAGKFTCSDPFLYKLWEKAQRTLYITMRDNYMDCPDRERAQWIGDAVNEAGEAFYALDTKSHLLQKKCLYELINWQRKDSTLFAPVPAGNWNKELPSQVLTCVGYYGIWNYYLNTGDLQTIADLYDGVKKYLGVWKINSDSTVAFRTGEWTWGDWGDNIDIHLMYNPLYYLALKGMRNMALVLGKKDDAAGYEQGMIRLKKAFNDHFWNGKAYRSPDYKGETDDRCQALAVVSGLADKDKYPAIFEVLKKEEHASPYMEKYVMEALFMMGYEGYAIERTERRFGDMVNNPDYTTLFEGWGIGKKGFGGGTVNHAWSGGGLTVLSQYLCGIAPAEPGYKVFQILPQPGPVAKASATVISVKGGITSSFINEANVFTLNASVPEGTSAVIGIPGKGFTTIRANGRLVWKKGRYVKNKMVQEYSDHTDNHTKFTVPAGKWSFVAE